MKPDIFMNNGQRFEVFSSLKEALKMVYDCFLDNELCGEDDHLYIVYKDGSTFQQHGVFKEGKFKKTNIQTIIYDNVADEMVYGKYEIVNIGDDELPIYIAR